MGSVERRVAALLAVSVALLLSGVFALVLVGDDPVSVAESIRRLRAYVDEHRTAHVEGEEESRWGAGADGLGSTEINRSRFEGDIRVPDAAHVVDESGEWAFETITLRAGVFQREATGRDDLDDELWLYTPASDVDDRLSWLEEVPDDIPPSTLGRDVAREITASGPPLDLGRMLASLREVTRLDGGTLRAAVRGRDVLPRPAVEQLEALRRRLGDDIDLRPVLDQRITLRISHDGDGRLDELTMTSGWAGDGERVVQRMRVRFSQWGGPVAIDPPPASDVDLTPAIDEEAVAEFDLFPLLAPRAVPAGFELHSLDVYEQDEEYEECASVELEYGPAGATSRSGPQPDESPALSFAMVDRECPWVSDWERDAGPPHPLKAGAYDARLFEDAEANPHTPLLEGRTIVFDIGRTHVVAASNLPVDQLVAAVSELSPLDLRTQPVARQAPPRTPA